MPGGRGAKGGTETESVFALLLFSYGRLPLSYLGIVFCILYFVHVKKEVDHTLESAHASLPCHNLRLGKMHDWQNFYCISLNCNGRFQRNFRFLPYLRPPLYAGSWKPKEGKYSFFSLSQFLSALVVGGSAEILVWFLDLGACFRTLMLNLRFLVTTVYLWRFYTSMCGCPRGSWMWFANGFSPPVCASNGPAKDFNGIKPGVSHK